MQNIKSDPARLYRLSAYCGTVILKYRNTRAVSSQLYCV